MSLTLENKSHVLEGSSASLRSPDDQNKNMTDKNEAPQISGQVF